MAPDFAFEIKKDTAEAVNGCEKSGTGITSGEFLPEYGFFQTK